jgi:hypothetical protein
VGVWLIVAGLALWLAGALVSFAVETAADRPRQPAAPTEPVEAALLPSEAELPERRPVPV